MNTKVKVYRKKRHALFVKRSADTGPCCFEIIAQLFALHGRKLINHTDSCIFVRIAVQCFAAIWAKQLMIGTPPIRRYFAYVRHCVYERR